MSKLKVLFVCIHNSARSQMAEKFLNEFDGDNFIAESAGIEPGNLNPTVVQVMEEIGFDISKNRTKSVFELHSQNKTYNYVITVCDPEAAEQCPIFPTESKRLHWFFKDPSSFIGSIDEKIEFTRVIRDEIKMKIKEFLKEETKTQNQ
ncbi:arsenate reductase ArsC [bacterium]|nr:arsenate reductase ArsC [bacterium]